MNIKQETMQRLIGFCDAVTAHCELSNKIHGQSTRLTDSATTQEYADALDKVRMSKTVLFAALGKEDWK
jgi:hypothetical protein